jgi:isopropylmalate/homocitrate/citramalate synthase
MLCDALEKLTGARGAKSLTVDASDTAVDFFTKRGYVAKQRNSVTQRRMARQYLHDAEDAGRCGSAEFRHEPRTPLSVRYHLRDGAQTNGVDFTLHDKQIIAQMLDELGIDYIEGSYPAPIRPTPNSLLPSRSSIMQKFTAFGMTRRPGRSASNDPGLADPGRQGGRDLLCRKILRLSGARRVESTNEENLASIRDSVTAAKAAGREVMVDCEHFFDGYKENREFALACARRLMIPARWVVLCDTNGGTMPHEVETIVSDVVKHIPGGRRHPCP